MAERDDQERTEQATPKRLQEAREKGQVPRSRELNMVGVMLAAAGAVMAFSGSLGEDLSRLVSSGLSFSRDVVFDPTAVPRLFREFILAAVRMLIPLMLVLLAAALLTPALIGGWNFSLKALQPKFSKLNPLSGFKRMFGVKGLMELTKALLKTLLVGAVGLVVLWWFHVDMLKLGLMPVQQALQSASGMWSQAFLLLCASLIVIALIDVPYQLWDHAKQLRMTRQEVRDEAKETDGRPEVKSKVRALQQEMANRRMMQDVPGADVVVTNPTHYSVALKYDDGGAGAPRVVAKGVDHMAARIRVVAGDHGVPLFEAPPLARALYRTTEIGDEIPADLYVAVAQVLTYVYQLRDAGTRRGPAPVRPTIEVNEPPETGR